MRFQNTGALEFMTGVKMNKEKLCMNGNMTLHFS